MTNQPRIRVLIAEDSPTQAARLRYFLEKQEFEVQVASDGEAALEALAEYAPHVIVSDIVMPVMDGYELCRRVKADVALSVIPVILVTGLADPEDVIKGLEAGASNFLTKPYNEDALVERIHQTLDGTLAHETDDGSIEVCFAGRKCLLRSDARQMIGFLLSTFEDAVAKNVQLAESNSQLQDAVKTITRLESRYRQLMETSAEAMLVVGTDGVVWYANHAAELLFHRDSEDLKGMPFPFELKLDSPTEIDFPLRDGTTVFAELRVVETQWGGQPAFLASFWDVTENVLLRERLRDMSLTDELTGLHNRRGFMTLAEQQIKLAKRGDRELVMLFADMDGLKRINDTWGHSAGDSAIAETAAIMRATLRDSDIVARVGGDEFASLLVDVTKGAVPLVASRLLEAFERRNANKATEWELGISVGTVSYDPDNPLELEALMNAADELMYAEKVRRKAARA